MLAKVTKLIRICNFCYYGGTYPNAKFIKYQISIGNVCFLSTFIF